MQRITFILGCFTVLTGCGTTRVTDTQRSASEMLLVSQAIDQAVTRIDFSPMKGKTVFLDDRQLAEDTVDRGYVVSSLKQQLLAHGALLMEDRKSAIYVVEPRSGGVGTDRHTLLVGSPALSIPAVIPGTPTNLPEIALVKKTDQKGIAKLGVYAYNRVNGRAVWQSGMVEEVSNLKDTWVFGAGPFSRGSIRRRTELAGEPLPTLPTLPSIPFVHTEDHESVAKQAAADEAALGAHPSTKSHEYPTSEPLPLQPVPYGLMGLVGPGAIVDRPLIR
ncbi:MAG: DUF6655 family protein [Gemmataceae bacterium]